MSKTSLSRTLRLPDARMAVGMTLDQLDQLATASQTHPVVVADQIIADSVRTRILRLVAEEGPFEDTIVLRKALVRSDENIDVHAVTHLLGSLNRAGHVAYVTHRKGTVQFFTKIRATPAGCRAAGLPAPHAEVGRKRVTDPAQHPNDPTDFRTHARTAQGGPIERRHVAPEPRIERVATARPAPIASPSTTTVQPTQEPTPMPTSARSATPATDAPTWPLLEALRKRRAATAEGRAQAEKLLEAAAIVEAFAPDEARRLLARAEALPTATFSEAEDEYLRYAEKAEAAIRQLANRP